MCERVSFSGKKKKPCEETGGKPEGRLDSERQKNRALIGRDEADEGCELGERMSGACAKSLSFYTERGADFFSTCLSPHTGAGMLQCTASLLLMNSSMNSPHKNGPRNTGFFITVAGCEKQPLAH